MEKAAFSISAVQNSSMMYLNEVTTIFLPADGCNRQALIAQVN